MTTSFCALLAGAVAVVVYAQTRGLQDWTFETQRRQEIRTGRMVAPRVVLRDSSAAGWIPWAPEGSSDHVYVVDFIYTRCPGWCEGLGTQFKLMQRQLQRQPRSSNVSLLSISFDLDGDTPEMLAGYAQRHAAEVEFWRVAMPAGRDDGEKLLRTLGIVAVPDGVGGFVHNSALHVIDGAGYVRGVYDYGNWDAALKGAQSIARQRVSDPSLISQLAEVAEVEPAE